MSDVLKRMLVLAALLITLPSVCLAVPGIINYQGKLTDSVGTPVTGNKPIVFSMYTTATGGTSAWNETQSVTLTDGAFSVALGTYSSIDPSLFVEDAVYLGIKVGSDAEMTPRQRLTSVSYAFKAENVGWSGLTGVPAGFADGADDDTLYSEGTGLSLSGNEFSLDTTYTDNRYLNSGGDYVPAMLTFGPPPGSPPFAVDSSNSTIVQYLNADRLDDMDATDIIDAASDEVRIPISSVPIYINSPGSYYFTGDMTYPSTTGQAVHVVVDHVAIDMMGYSLIGPGTTPNTSKGVLMTGRTNVTIRNGTIRDFGNYGIADTSAGAKGHRLVDLCVVGNGFRGISLAGADHLIRDCTVLDNGDYGIFVTTGNTITGNISSNNTIMGIYAQEGCTITGNTAYNNGSTGITGYDGCTISDNTSYNNGNNGIYANNGCTVTNNTVYSNQYIGIYAGYGCKVTGNTARDNNLADNTAYAGIKVNSFNVVSGNMAHNNNQKNILVTSYNTVEYNFAANSLGYGIYFSNNTNFYANNRASQNATLNYGGNLPTGPNHDGGGNVSF